VNRLETPEAVETLIHRFYEPLIARGVVAERDPSPEGGERIAA
jgi:hypothetical protein